MADTRVSCLTRTRPLDEVGDVEELRGNRNAGGNALPPDFSKFNFFSSKPPGRKQKQKWKTPRKNSNRKRGFVGTLFIYRFRKPGKPGKAGKKQKSK